MNETLERCRRNLVRRGFEARIAATAEEARQILWEEIRAAAPETICFGDSMTMKATGIVDDLHRDGHYRLFDGFDPAMPRPQKLEIRRQGLLADLFITGINAVTEDGALLWLDMIGNRIAPIAPGTQQDYTDPRSGRRADPHHRGPAEHSPASGIPHALRRNGCLRRLLFGRPYLQHAPADGTLFSPQADYRGVDRRRPRLVKAPEENETEDYDFLLTI